METHRALLDALGLDDLIGAVVPLPADWIEDPAVSVAKGKLKAYVEASLAKENRAWAIKDPRLWRRNIGASGRGACDPRPRRKR